MDFLEELGQSAALLEVNDWSERNILHCQRIAVPGLDHVMIEDLIQVRKVTSAGISSGAPHLGNAHRPESVRSSEHYVEAGYGG